MVCINVTDEGPFFLLFSTFISDFGTLLGQGSFPCYHEQRFNHQMSFGTLCNGRRIVCYSVLFYEDSFEFSCSPYMEESLAGVYLKYLPLYPNINSFTSSNTLLFLNPHAHKCLNIFHYI